MTVPYNTGKVKIGHAYTRPVRRRMSRDEEALQEVLIGKPLEEARTISPSLIAYFVSAAAMFASLLLLTGG